MRMYFRVHFVWLDTVFKEVLEVVNYILSAQEVDVGDLSTPVVCHYYVG